jgi:hypothetical protein
MRKLHAFFCPAALLELKEPYKRRYSLQIGCTTHERECYDTSATRVTSWIYVKTSMRHGCCFFDSVDFVISGKAVFLVNMIGGGKI